MSVPLLLMSTAVVVVLVKVVVAVPLTEVVVQFVFLVAWSVNG